MATVIDICSRRGAGWYVQDLRRGLPPARNPALSTGRVGSTYDNALAESFFQGLKRLLRGRAWLSKTQTLLELFRGRYGGRTVPFRMSGWAGSRRGDAPVEGLTW